MGRLYETPHVVHDASFESVQHAARCERAVAYDGGGGGRKIRLANKRVTVVSGQKLRQADICRQAGVYASHGTPP